MTADMRHSTSAKVLQKYICIAHKSNGILLCSDRKSASILGDSRGVTSITEGKIAQKMIHGCIQSWVHLDQQAHPDIGNHSYAVDQQEEQEKPLLHVPSACTS